MGESARPSSAASLTIRPTVGEAISVANDARLSADHLTGAARQAVAAWARAVAGDGTELASMTSENTAHWLLHPPNERWQVAPGAVVTEIEIWRLDAAAEPPSLRVSFRFAGRQRFGESEAGYRAGGGEAGDDTLFTGELNLTLASSGSWRLASGHVRTLDDFYGYVFTSRRETAEEYVERTGSAAPATSAASRRTFRITAGFAEHDERFGGSASIVVRRDAAPNRDQAEQLIWPAVTRVTVEALGEGDWQPSLNWLDVIELWPDRPGAH